MIDKSILISDILTALPGSEKIFLNHGMACLGCAKAKFETLGQAADAHGVDVDVLIGELNEFALRSAGGGCGGKCRGCGKH
ncbi:MAG: DUF1858 domain-containing protein [Firmicutes bacterium]|nr:DUF1858 domain-containing protein [Bacillota bacterium]